MYLLTVSLFSNSHLDSKYISLLIASIRNDNSSIVIMSIKTRDKSTFEFLLKILPSQQQNIFAIQFLYLDAFLLLTIFNNAYDPPYISLAVRKPKDVIMSVNIIKFVETWLFYQQNGHSQKKLQIFLDLFFIWHRFLLR